jgi:hypothetical protein
LEGCGDVASDVEQIDPSSAVKISGNSRGPPELASDGTSRLLPFSVIAPAAAAAAAAAVASATAAAIAACACAYMHHEEKGHSQY